MISTARAAATHSHGSVRCSEKQRSSPNRIGDLARRRIPRYGRGFADNHPEWREYPSKGQNIPQWIKKLDVPTEVQRTLFRHSSGREYEIGIWAHGDHRNRFKQLEKIRSQLLPNLQLALRQQRMPVSVTAIKAAMIAAGRLPLYKILHQSINESFEFHACLSSQPKEELGEIYQAFEQQVKRKVDQIEQGIQLKKQEEKDYFDRHGYSKEDGWEAVKYLNSLNREMETASGEISVTEVEDAQFPDTSTFSLPDYMQKVTAVKINKMIFKHHAGKFYEVGVWAYPRRNALETMQELLRENSPLNAAMEELSESLAKKLSASLELQHKPYTFRASAAASQVAGRAPLSKTSCHLPDGEVQLESFVCRQPVKEGKEVKQAFEKQIKEAIPKCTISSPFEFRLERYFRYRRETLIGSPPDHFMEGMMLWKDRIKETERLLEWSEEGLPFSKRELKWLIDWESDRIR